MKNNFGWQVSDDEQQQQPQQKHSVLLIVLDVNLGIEFDTIPINKTCDRYDFDIWHIEAFVQYLRTNHGVASCERTEGKTRSMRYPNFDISIN